MRRVLALCVTVAALALIACEEAPASEPLARGRQLYRKLDCGRCHVIDGEGGRIGPDLSRIGAVAAEREAGTSAEAYIRRSILDPGAYVVPGFSDVMPRGLARTLSDTDREALVQFLASHR